ncbi:MAG: ribonuclease inhibitor [Sphingomonas phyllosphaerae]|uniref:barstar family protein n=1 Tax=Sphingomonas phyllosphaerae TaxID=257003 RepID=UPI002FF701C5
MKTLTIRGRSIRDIPSFYAEINRVFMAGEDWKLGESLDAFNDLLFGGYGAIAGPEPVELVWEDIEASRVALGIDTTRAHLLGKLRQPERYSVAVIQQQLDRLEGRDGSTYFDTILDIIREHPNLKLAGR